MESDLTSRLPLKEHIKNIRNILAMICSIDKTYFFFTGIVHIINVTVPYLGLILSAYILDALPDRSFEEIMLVTVTATVGIFVLNFIASTIWNKMEVHRLKVYYLYESATDAKMLTMDFSRIDSPEVRELKQRIRKDMNWGDGINSVFFAFHSVLYGIFNIVGAVILGMPMLVQVSTAGRYEAGVIFGVIVLTAVFGMKARMHFQKKHERFMYEQLKEDEKEEEYSFCWMFPFGNGYHYKNGKDIRIYHGYDLMERWTVEVLRHKAYRKRLTDGAKGTAGSGFFGSFTSVLMEGGAYLTVAVIALGGGVSIGNVVKFAGCLKSLMAAVSWLIIAVQDLAVTARRHISTLELLEVDNEMYDGKLPVEKRSDHEYQIEFKNVSFRYPGTEQYALKNFSMKLTIGEKLAIVGMNGSGKTTMIKLLCRLYDPEEGEILLNGVDIRKFKQREYSQLFSVVFQDYKLFPFGLGENVAVSPEYDAKEVRECLYGAGFEERLEALERGLDTYLYKEYDDNGIEISGGEEQKIAIARAVYKDAPFILLDEPTAALDPISEYEIYTNFDKIVGTKTAIYISHRLSSCRFCEKIAVFHEGRLVQLGSHEELLKDTEGKYFEMWNAQAQYYQEEAG